MKHRQWRASRKTTRLQWRSRCPWTTSRYSSERLSILQWQTPIQALVRPRDWRTRQRRVSSRGLSPMYWIPFWSLRHWSIVSRKKKNMEIQETSLSELVELWSLATKNSAISSILSLTWVYNRIIEIIFLFLFLNELKIVSRCRVKLQKRPARESQGCWIISVHGWSDWNDEHCKYRRIFWIIRFQLSKICDFV